MNLLLDTNVFIWMQEGNERLPIEWRKMIQNPAHTKSISIVSLWEIAIKTNIGKLEFDIPLINAVPKEINIIAISINHLECLQTLELHHRDPFDRLIIAQAIEQNMTIMTSDERFKDYPVSLL